jgi:hypothetical protein
MQPKIGPAALVGYGKTIAADPDLASSNNGKADATRSDDDDAAISGAMRPDTGDRRVMSVNDRAEGMRPQHELLEHTFAADPSKSDGSVHGAQHIGVKSGFLERDAAGLFHFGKRAVYAYAQRRWAGNAGSKQASFRVLDARTAARSATVNSDEQRTRL